MKRFVFIIFLFAFLINNSIICAEYKYEVLSQVNNNNITNFKFYIKSEAGARSLGGSLGVLIGGGIMYFIQGIVSGCFFSTKVVYSTEQEAAPYWGTLIGSSFIPVAGPVIGCVMYALITQRLELFPYAGGLDETGIWFCFGLSILWEVIELIGFIGLIVTLATEVEVVFKKIKNFDITFTKNSLLEFSFKHQL